MAQGIDAQTVTGPEARDDFRRSLKKAWRPWRQRPLGVLGAVLVALVLIVAFAAPLLAPYDPKEFVGSRLESPSSSFLLGTNTLGQDVLSRTIHGAQISIAVGMSASILGVGMGVFLGIISGYFGGWPDLIIQRLLEVLASFPGLILALVMISAVGRPQESGSNLLALTWQLRSLETAIAISLVFASMRVIRSAVIGVRNMAYIEAAESVGASPARIMRRHILPNVAPYIIFTFTAIVAVVILTEAALSFLGFGVSAGTPSWGIDLSRWNRDFFLQAPWLLLAPGVALSITVLGFNFLGDALRDILDPRLRSNAK